MNRSDLVEEIARRSRQTHHRLLEREVRQVIDLLIELVAEELSRPDGRVGLLGVGILEVQSFRVGGQLKDIRTGEMISLDDNLRYRVRFKAALPLKNALRDAALSDTSVEIE